MFQCFTLSLQERIRKKIRSKGKDFSVSACQYQLILHYHSSRSGSYPLPTNPTNPITHPSLDPINKQTNCKAWSLGARKKCRN
ncbi:hypothetical protein BDA96_03G417000 [Sorghum bicolor]|uniref:Uncharacterized protein n=1 Tax=Sorghum bicolor TaxID=4558 RepID=A0A921RJ01_SORBI|nr:hypothetical protein BDA96_03G417000 [Sorghum bicolor]